MKSLLLTFVLLAACLGTYAQGTITFNNSAALKITNGFTLTGAAGVRVALYWSADTNASPGSLAIATAFVTNTLSGANAGLFIGGPRALPGAVGGQIILAQIRAWSGGALIPGPFATYEDAVTAANSDFTTIFGGSQLFTLQLGGNGFPTASLTAPGKMNAFYIFPALIDPEPSTVELGVLGLGIAALFHRRKKRGASVSTKPQNRL